MEMGPRYKIGDRVIVTPAKEPSLSVRDSALDPYSGQTGEVTNYHWISLTTGKTFYIYTVRIGASHKEAVLHEDEIEPLTA